MAHIRPGRQRKWPLPGRSPRRLILQPRRPKLPARFPVRFQWQATRCIRGPTTGRAEPMACAGDSDQHLPAVTKIKNLTSSLIAAVSPARRRNTRRFLEKIVTGLVGQSADKTETHESCSLSPGERVRARAGNKTKFRTSWFDTGPLILGSFPRLHSHRWRGNLVAHK